MAAEILLTSETFVKSTTNISDNLAGKFVLPSIREAQEVNFRGIVGDCLLAKLKDLVRIDPQTQTRPIEAAENSHYKDLLDRAQYFLAYQTIVELCNKVSYKIANGGVIRTSDENIQPVSADEIDQQKTYYQSKADAHCYQLQNWILENADQFPELRSCDCDKIRANLYSAATCGIWLGGPRGKILPGGGGCCK